MSIVNFINELQSIKLAITKHNQENASLRKRAKIIEQQITEYLESKDQPGVKFQDTAIIVDKQQKYSYKSKKDTEEDSLKILEDHGISNRNNKNKD